jgi:2-polyprenyl-6-methoxyphenol hydroxylase-like FAD-dependent oxidoreductase
LTAPLRIAVIGGGLAAAVSLLRVEFDVDVYEKAPQLNEVSGDIRGGVPWRRAREIVAEPMVRGLTAGGKWIRTLGPAKTGDHF